MTKTFSQNVFKISYSLFKDIVYIKDFTQEKAYKQSDGFWFRHYDIKWKTKFWYLSV